MINKTKKMDFTIEKLCKEFLPKSENIVTLGHEILLADFDEKDTTPENKVDGTYSAVIKTNFAVVLLCRSGSIKLKLDLEKYVLRRNQLIIMIPGMICQHIESSADCSVTIFAFDKPQHIREPSSDIALIPRRYLYQKPLLELNERQVEEFLSICAVMRSRILQPDYCFKKEIVSALLQVLYLDISNLMQKSMNGLVHEMGDRNKQIYNAFMDEMLKDKGLHREISYYADRLCITAKYLSRIVKATSGRYAKEWIKDYVILQAKSMLDSGQYTIQQVSDKLNFPNQSFFGTYFKSSVGCSPKAYMERN